MKSIVPIIIFYILGIIIGLYIKISIVLIFCGIIIFLIIAINDKKTAREILIISVPIIIGAIYMNFYSINWETISKNIKSDGVTVEIVNLEKETEQQKTFKAKILNGKYRSKLVLLKINKKLTNKISIGSKIKIYGEKQEIDPARNTGGFDYKEYLKSKKIYAVIKIKNFSILNDKNISINKIKNYIIEETYKKMDKQSADLCLALSIGYKSGLEDDIKENFSKINLSHMIAISGLHITYLMIFLNFILKHLKSKTKSIIIIIFIIFFMCLTGNTPSVARACIMIILEIIPEFFYRKPNKNNNLAISALYILAYNPYSIKDLGFIFSYVGILGIIIIYPILREKTDYFIIQKNIMNYITRFKNDKINICINIFLEFCEKTALNTISANILLFPLLIYNFNTFSIIFIFCNIIFTPIFTVYILFSFFMICMNSANIKLFDFLNIFYNIITNMITKSTSFLSNIEIFNLLFSTPHIYELILIYLIIFFWIYLEKNNLFKYKFTKFIKEKIKTFFNFKNVTIVIIILSIIFSVASMRKKDLKIYFVDVGQGDCTLIVTPNNKKILIDGGGSDNKDYDIGKKVLVPYLLDRRIKNIDYIIISHFDTDHVRRII